MVNWLALIQQSSWMNGGIIFISQIYNALFYIPSTLLYMCIVYCQTDFVEKLGWYASVKV